MTWGPPPEGAWPTGSPGPAGPPASPYGAVAWQPAGPPVGVPASAQPLPGPPGRPGPPGPPADRRRRVLIGVVVGVVVVALGVIAGVVLGSGRDNPTPPLAGPSAGLSTAPTTSATTAAAPVTTAASTPQTSARPTASAIPSQLYAAPGGLSVQGPAGWVADGSAANDNIRDFRAPGSPARLAGATFRIGIGNIAPSGSFQDEVTQAANFQITDKAATILATSYTTFLGTTAGDIEYTYFNSDYNVQRHGVERIWRSGAVTLIIQSSDLATNWPKAAAVFRQLVASASVS